MRTSQVRTAVLTSVRTARSTRSPSAAAAPPAPIVLERYRLHRRLGAGAFGTVWMARDERLERDVAVKVLARERIVGGRFEREARVAARLTHPGIVTLYEAAVDDEGAYLVSELVRGATLDELLAAGRLSDRDILAIGIALCDALVHAHGQGVVHRDLKPSNVLVPEQPASRAELAKLTDFGVARVIGGDSLTITGDVIGTLAYMAPEQAAGLEVGAAADLYSLALVLYEGLTGVNPVRPSTAAQHARRLGAHLPPLRRQRRDLPRELGQGLDLALRPRPRERGTVAELRRALVAARDRVADEPGIVTAPWTRRADATGAGARSPFAETPSNISSLTENPSRPPPLTERRSRSPGVAEGRASAIAPVWLARGLAAAAAAGTAGWLSGELLAPAPLAPAAACLLAGGLTLLLPRVGWLALAGAACGTAISQGRPGGAIVVAIAMLVPILLLVRRPTAWPLAVAAPALGLIGLAGAWPALAGQAATPWRRAALGASGWVILLLATPIAGRTLYLPGWVDGSVGTRPPGTPRASGWISSPDQTLHQVLGPLVSSGVLVPALIWALGASILPWLTGGRWFALDLVRVVVWAAVLVSATGIAVTAVHAGHGLRTAPSATLGALAAAAMALAPSGLAAWRDRARATEPEAGFP